MIGSAELAGTLKSDNFVAGSAGWRMKKSGDLEINELTLRKGTVTNTKVSNTANRITLPHQSWTSLEEVTLVVSGSSPVQLIFSAQFTENNAQVAAQVQLRLRRGSTTTWGPVYPFSHYGVGLLTVSASDMFAEVPTSGSHTYRLQAYGQINLNVPGHSLYCERSSFIATEFRNG